MLTVKDIVSLLEVEYPEHTERTLTVAADGLVAPINRENRLAMAAYGNFIVDRIHVDELGVELAVKTEFCKAGA